MAILSDEKIHVLISILKGKNGYRPRYHYQLLNELIQDGLVIVNGKDGRRNKFELTILGLSIASDMAVLTNVINERHAIAERMKSKP